MDGTSITIVVGLPGSGKSTYCRKLAEDGRLEQSDKDDDYMRGDLGSGYGVEGVIERLKARKRCIVNDLGLAGKSKRDEIENRIRTQGDDVHIEWFFFDNDPLQSAANVILDALAGTRRSQAARKPTPESETGYPSRVNPYNTAQFHISAIIDHN